MLAVDVYVHRINYGHHPLDSVRHLMKSQTKDKIRRAGRERLKTSVSDGRLVVDAASSSLKRGFLRGISAQAHMVMPPVSAPAYKGRGLAGDWEKVGGDLWSALEDYQYRK